jgi:hypothetical protein
MKLLHDKDGRIDDRMVLLCIERASGSAQFDLILISNS